MQNNERIEKIKELIKEMTPYFIILATGIIIGLAATVIGNIPVRFLGINPNLGGFFVSLITTIIVLYMRGFRRGYSGNSRTYTFVLKKTIKLVAWCFAVQMVLSILIGPTVYIAGPTAWLVTFIKNPHTVTVAYRPNILDWLLMLVADGLFYGPAIVYGEYVGVKKHADDFPSAHKENTP